MCSSIFGGSPAFRHIHQTHFWVPVVFLGTTKEVPSHVAGIALFDTSVWTSGSALVFHGVCFLCMSNFHRFVHCLILLNIAYGFIENSLFPSFLVSSSNLLHNCSTFFSSSNLSSCPQFYIPGWWFGTFFVFPYIGKYHHLNWLSYFSEGWLNHQPYPEIIHR